MRTPNKVSFPPPCEDRAVVLRLAQIIGPGGLLPIARSTFYAKIKAGELPAPLKLGPRISVWRRSDIIAFIEQGGK